ncbi:hypothetical protein F5Y14DRAFT_426896 [Nemania sp. NC0429]|nr:hypothetical protein F5Y14DRAFT_426896 [Nemania sp. NC0429]
MSFTGNLFSKLGLGDAGRASFLPQYTSPPSRPVDEHHDEHDLAELSPRPEDSLLAGDTSDATPHRRSSSTASAPALNGASSIQASIRSGGYGVKASVAFQDSLWPPGRSDLNLFEYRPGQEIGQQREQNGKAPDVHHSHADTPGPPLSFFESMFKARPAYTERAPSPSVVDQSFKLLERRERQMQQELQHLLDAQDYALDKHLANTSPDDDVTPRSQTPVSSPPNGHVIPVRQPKKRHLSKKEARLGIARCMSLLSDLKNEEEAYIATALAERKAALSRLRNLSTKRNSIVAEMERIESDSHQPLKNQIKKMEHQHRAVCNNILELEEKLRELKHTKSKLESRIAEAKSARDSELSGYKGALNECDKQIENVMNYPKVSVLEVEGLMAQNADLRTLVGQHISGFEFLSLIPERRTPPMAKDWWEGEVQVLELRKITVDKERAALDEGTQLWQGMLGLLENHDRHLKSTFDAMSQYASKQQQHTTKLGDLGEVLKKQYIMCKETTQELEELYDYTETQGWNLLVTALGAEINYFRGLKTQLGETLHFVGWADGVVTPRPDTPSRANTHDGDDLLGIDHGNAEARPSSHLEEELTGSVLRRWEDTVELQHSTSNVNVGAQTDDHLDRAKSHEDSDNDNDNDVPPGLFAEEHHESDYEHNEVPPEFLFMHSPSPRSRGKAKGVMKTTSRPEEEGEAVERRETRGGGDGTEGNKRHEDNEEGQEIHALSRESSANEVPPDLLAESHRSVE